MIDLNSFTYYELETLKELIDSRISTNYRVQDRHPNVFTQRDKETKRPMS